MTEKKDTDKRKASVKGRLVLTKYGKCGKIDKQCVEAVEKHKEYEQCHTSLLVNARDLLARRHWCEEPRRCPVQNLFELLRPHCCCH